MGWPMFVAYLIITIISVAVSYALRPKPITPKPAELTDFDIPTADGGRPIPVIFGHVRVKSPNVVWFGDLMYQKIKRKTGGK